jgi:hypothetical protein
MTAAFTAGEGLAVIFLAAANYSLECLGLHVAKRSARFEVG